MADRVWQFHWTDKEEPLEIPEELVSGFNPGIQGVSMVELIDGSSMWIPWTNLKYVAAVFNHKGEEVIQDGNGSNSVGGEETGRSVGESMGEDHHARADNQGGGGGIDGGEGGVQP